MIGINNLRFNYQEKNQLFGGYNRPQKLQVAAHTNLVTNYELPAQPLDADQECQIQKKKKVFLGNSLNYTQIYSDIQISRNGKNQLKKSTNKERADMIQSRARIISQTEPLNSQLGYSIPKSLPKLGGRSKNYQQSQTSKYTVNKSVKNYQQSQSSNQTNQNKSFNIYHYDIFIQGNKKSTQKQFSTQYINHSKKRDQLFDNSPIIQQYRDREQSIKIKFENDTQFDLPEALKSEMFSQNISKVSRQQNYEAVIKPQQVQVQPSLSDLDKNEEQIVASEQPEQRGSMLKKKQINKRIVINTQEKLFQKKKIQNIIQEETRPYHRSPAIQNLEYSIQRKKPENQKNTVIYSEDQKHNTKQVLNLQDKQKKQKSHNPKPQQFLELQNSKNLNDSQQFITPNHIVSNTQYQATTRLKQKQAEIQQKVQEQSQKQVKQQIQIKRAFKFEEYISIYQILKRIQAGLKMPVIDTHGLLRQIKKYLQVVASGCLDHVQGYDMALHRLKIIKNSLLLQRIGMVIISLALATGKAREVQKYLINLIGYCTNNTLLILKILQTTKIEADVQKNAIIAKSQRLIMKRNFDTVRNNSDIVLDCINKISKIDSAFNQSFKQILKSIGKHSIQQNFYNVLEYFAFYLCVSDLHMSIPFLAVAPNPYLKQTIDDRPTLVIDIIQVLCHGTRKSKSHVFRPHSQHFIHEMSQYYELISFTCAFPNQIDKVIDLLDPKKHIKHRLYRHHSISRHQSLYKDTQRIGRDLSKLVLLDSESNIHQEINNTIVIPSWRGNRTDATLAQLCPILAAIAIKKLNCVEATKKIRQQQLKNQNAGIKYLNFGLNLS